MKNKREEKSGSPLLTLVSVVAIGYFSYTSTHSDVAKDEGEPKVTAPIEGADPIGKTSLRFLSAFADWFNGEEYDEEWLEQIKMFENAPLYTGAISESIVHDDRLKKSVREVGYGVTDAEIYEAKRLGLLPPDAILPKRMSRAEADQWFKQITIPTYERCVEEVVKIPLNPEQKFALISFCHNLGKGNLQKLTMQKGRLGDSNYGIIARYIPLYDNAGRNKNVAGLVKRRNWEAKLWLSGTHDYSSEVAKR